MNLNKIINAKAMLILHCFGNLINKLIKIRNMIEGNAEGMRGRGRPCKCYDESDKEDSCFYVAQSDCFGKR